MSLLAKFAAVEEARRGLGETDPTRTVIERLESPTLGIINGVPTILAGTNNYLGMTFDAEAVAAGREALTEAGTGTTGSRMANGTYAAHVALEAELADFYGYPAAVVFSTGYAANLGALAALLGEGDAVLLDADAHASLFDGCRLSSADLYTFRHNDPASLDKRLNRLGERAHNALVVVEGLYGVLGDRAPLADIAAVKARHGACLLVDEAHSLGVVGAKGRGVVEEAGVMDQVDFVVGTFSKSLGTMGGFCASRHQEVALFPYASRPYMFTASPSPATIACTRAALKVMRSRPDLKHRLWRNANRLHQGISQLGVGLGEAISPVMSVRLKGREDALAAWHGLLAEGVYVNLFLPPAAPGGGSLLRMSVSAAHTEDQIDRIIAALAKVMKAVGASG